MLHGFTQNANVFRKKSGGNERQLEQLKGIVAFDSHLRISLVCMQLFERSSTTTKSNSFISIRRIQRALTKIRTKKSERGGSLPTMAKFTISGSNRSKQSKTCWRKRRLTASWDSAKVQHSVHCSVHFRSSPTRKTNCPSDSQSCMIDKLFVISCC